MKNDQLFLLTTAICLAATTALHCEDAAPRAKDPIKVFILAGQSNMEGKARVSLLAHQADEPRTQEELGHLRQDGEWVVREDVWIKFLDRKGDLTVGFGSRDRIGPELEFGNVVGDHHAEQVLLIKTAWGGKSLYRDFRSPSSGKPPPPMLEKLLAQARKKRPEATMADVQSTFGACYRHMLREIRETLADLQEHFPAAQGRDHEIAGFIWFQGWNDMVNADYTAAYTENMVHFIRDVRKDLDTPELPFVIGVLGVGGDREKKKDKKRTFKQAQAAAGKVGEFRDNVAVVHTDRYWDWDADAVFAKGWKENLEEWNTVGSDRPYHYLGSVRTMVRIGRAFAEAVLELRREK